MERQNYSSGSPLEESAGYSRMVRIGQHICIGGTTSVTPEGGVFGETAAEQTRFILQKFIHLLNTAGASPCDVFRIKGYLTNMQTGKEVAAVFTEFFGSIRPLFTLVETPALNRTTQLVELELEAMIGCTLVQNQQNQ